MARRARQMSPWQEAGNRKYVFMLVCRQAGMTLQRCVNDSFRANSDCFSFSFSRVSYKYKSLKSNDSLSMFQAILKRIRKKVLR